MSPSRGPGSCWPLCPDGGEWRRMWSSGRWWRHLFFVSIPVSAPPSSGKWSYVTPGSKNQALRRWMNSRETSYLIWIRISTHIWIQRSFFDLLSIYYKPARYIIIYNHFRTRSEIRVKFLQLQSLEDNNFNCYIFTVLPEQWISCSNVYIVWVYEDGGGDEILSTCIGWNSEHSAS